MEAEQECSCKTGTVSMFGTCLLDGCVLASQNAQLVHRLHSWFIRPL